jgi:cupin fold WbuC family metalloprotein
MVITNEILDELSVRARESERLRVNLDLRNSADDQSQRMLNALEPGTVMPIQLYHGRGTGHWHIKVNPSEVSVSLNRAA